MRFFLIFNEINRIALDKLFIIFEHTKLACISWQFFYLKIKNKKLIKNELCINFRVYTQPFSILLLIYAK